MRCPQTAVATVNCRIFPGNTTEEIRAELQRVAGDEVEVTLVGAPVDSVASPMRQDLLEAVTRAVHASYPGTRIVPDQASYIHGRRRFPRRRNSHLRRQRHVPQGQRQLRARAQRTHPGSMPSTAALTHWYALIKELAGRP